MLAPLLPPQVMHNPDYWQDPSCFRPSRFVDPSTGRFRRDERCIPFMMGKRFCIGQTLAQDQLFLFFAGLINKFEFTVRKKKKCSAERNFKTRFNAS